MCCHTLSMAKSSGLFYVIVSLLWAAHFSCQFSVAQTHNTSNALADIGKGSSRSLLAKLISRYGNTPPQTTGVVGIVDGNTPHGKTIGANLVSGILDGNIPRGANPVSGIVNGNTPHKTIGANLVGGILEGNTPLQTTGVSGTVHGNTPDSANIVSGILDGNIPRGANPVIVNGNIPYQATGVKGTVNGNTPDGVDIVSQIVDGNTPGGIVAGNFPDHTTGTNLVNGIADDADTQTNSYDSPLHLASPRYTPLTKPPYPTPHYCFEDKCRCKNNTADCSQNFGRLPYIPGLPQEITFVNFTFNNVTSIADAGFFVNVTNVTGLDLSDNGLLGIGQAAFSSLPFLQVLIMRNHKLHYVGLAPAFSVSTLQYLDVSEWEKLGPIPDDLFAVHRLPHLRTLCLNDSGIFSLNMTVFRYLRSLRELHLGGNQVSHLFYTDELPRLSILVLSINGLFTFPQTCVDDNEESLHSDVDEDELRRHSNSTGPTRERRKTSTSLFPDLRELYLRNNLLSVMPHRVCLPNLLFLDLSCNMFQHLVTGMFNNRLFPSLQTLYLGSMSIQIETIASHALSNSALRHLSLMYNNIDFSVPAIHSRSFGGLQNLTHLQLGHNYVNLVTSDRFVMLFRELTSLGVICVGVSFVNNISRAMFQPLQKLRRILFYDNQLTTLPDGMFDDLPHLRYVYLGGNSLSSITERTFSAATRQRLKHLDLSGSGFECDCNLMWFREWLVNNPRTFFSSYYNYTCYNLPEINVQDFYLNPQACIWSPQTYQFIDVILTLIILTLTFVTFLFRFRWHLRLLFYEAFRVRGELRRRRLQKGQFEYDVFVSYAKPDLMWVKNYLLPELEGRLKLRLCIHERNFLIGNDIVDNIVQSVDTSKKIMMIFSKSFVRSQWCQFELNYCLRYVMDYDDALLIVCLNDFTSHHMTSAMMAVMKTTTYIRWDDSHVEAMASFWGRIGIALHEIIPRTSVCRRTSRRHRMVQ